MRCFNEAPAKCRGILEGLVPAHERRLQASMRPQRNAGEYGARLPVGYYGQAASMRPQRNAGEYGRAVIRGGRSVPRFNEAPAKCRGIPYDILPSLCKAWGFNEAPAKCRGIRHYALRQSALIAQASMRPQRNAGEYPTRLPSGPPTGSLQ